MREFQIQAMFTWSGHIQLFLFTPQLVIQYSKCKVHKWHCTFVWIDKHDKLEIWAEFSGSISRVIFRIIFLLFCLVVSSWPSALFCKTMHIVTGLFLIWVIWDESISINFYCFYHLWWNHCKKLVSNGYHEIANNGLITSDIISDLPFMETVRRNWWVWLYMRKMWLIRKHVWTIVIWVIHSATTNEV